MSDQATFGVEYPPHMWLAGDGEGVILVCEGTCRDTGVGDLVIAEYGLTDLQRGVPHFALTALTGFLAFVTSHALSCLDKGGER